MDNDSVRESSDPPLRLSRGWRWTLYLGAAVLLGVGFLGYLSPSIALSWETLVALCGF